MRLGDGQPGAVVDLDGVALGVKAVHAKGDAVTYYTLYGDLLLLEEAMEGLELGQGVDLE